MKIKRLTIQNFGKIHNCHLDFSPGINVLYGENESGKTTVHTFLKSMFYGISRSRGRGAKNDDYSTFEPWDDPMVYGGTIWFESGGKNFRLSRNFHKNNPKDELFCQDDGEILDIGSGDLDAILGDVSEAVYENTVSIGQLKSVTGPDLVHELQNYMMSYQGTGDASVDLLRTNQLLKMNRKGFQTQLEHRERENQKEIEKLSVNKSYIHQELEEAYEKKSELDLRQEALLTSGKEGTEERLEYRIEAAGNRVSAFTGFMLILGVLSIALAVGAHMLKSAWIWLPILLLLLGIAGEAFLWQVRRRAVLEYRKRIRTKEHFSSKAQQLEWNKQSLDETIKEKGMDLKNIEEEQTLLKEKETILCPESMEIEAINMAMETIEMLSARIHSQVGDRLRERTSMILSEITLGKYNEVLIDEDIHMTVNTEDRIIPLERLSRGTLEQIYFALRMAAGEMLCGDEEFPVILDDVFGMYDEARLKAVLRWLSKEKRQIIISTCNKREMQILKQENIPYQEILL